MSSLSSPKIIFLLNRLANERCVLFVYALSTSWPCLETDEGGLKHLHRDIPAAGTMASQGIFRYTAGYLYSSAIHSRLLSNIFQIKPIPVGFNICMSNVKLPEDLPFAVKRKNKTVNRPFLPQLAALKVPG
ncbi:hypothetical protein A9798_07585 [Edwardsiella hoshinae]|uniref:Uncharacterized protein n=1 Tax=Edwardsiella hoshinae TaxID=93378 RepID=A0ABM6EIQ8_9GAMM|nr:hypothetical protein A9798_07585 [Edwardsiella hoshinae]